MHRFIPLQGALGRVKRPKAEPRIDAAFHKPMILFHDVIQVLLLPELAVFGKWPRLLEGLERRGIGRVLVHCDDTRWDRMACPQSLAEKPLGGLGVSRRTQQKVEGISLGIDGPVEIVPLLLDLDVGPVTGLLQYRPMLVLSHPRSPETAAGSSHCSGPYIGCFDALDTVAGRGYRPRYSPNKIRTHAAACGGGWETATPRRSQLGPRY